MNVFDSDPERQARVEIVKNAIAIARMKGQPSAYRLEQRALFKAGEISVTEMRDRVIGRARERSKD